MAERLRDPFLVTILSSDYGSGDYGAMNLVLRYESHCWTGFPLRIKLFLRSASLTSTCWVGLLHRVCVQGGVCVVECPSRTRGSKRQSLRGSDCVCLIAQRGRAFQKQSGLQGTL